MYYDSLDICEAHYLFASLFHGGQGCAIYAKFGQLDRLRFKPSPILSKPADLNPNAKEIFRSLVVKHCGIHSTTSHHGQR